VVEIDYVPEKLDIRRLFGRELTPFGRGFIIEFQGYFWELEVFWDVICPYSCNCEHNLKEPCGGSVPPRLHYILLAKGTTEYKIYGMEATEQRTRGRSTSTTRGETRGHSVGMHAEVEVGGLFVKGKAGVSAQKHRSVSRSRSEQRSESASTTVPLGLDVRVLGWSCRWSVERHWQGLIPCEPCVDRSLETPPAVPPKAEEAPEPRKPEGDKKEEGDGRGGKKASASQAYRRQHGG
jgi:hypothetical protein